MKQIVLAFVVCAVLVPSGDCLATARRRIGKQIDCPARLEKALHRYDHKRYSEAATYLDEIRYQCAGHSIIDSVLYFLGMSYLQGKKPIEAQTEFERLIQNYPNSVFYQEAHFRLADCVFRQSKDYSRDQTETHDAIVRFREFVDLYPDNPHVDSARVLIAACYDKLARKEFENARFYDRIDEPEAAVVYYRSLLSAFPESDYVSDALLNLAEALLKTSRITEASTVVNEILDGKFSDEVRRKAEILKGRIDSK